MAVEPSTYIDFESGGSDFCPDLVGGYHAQLINCSRWPYPKFGNYCKADTGAAVAACLDFGTSGIPFKTVTFWCVFYNTTQQHAFLGGLSASGTTNTFYTNTSGTIYFNGSLFGGSIPRSETVWAFVAIREGANNNEHQISVNNGTWTSVVTTNLGGVFRYFGPPVATTGLCGMGIDDIRVFNTVLSDADVTEIYNYSPGPYVPTDPKSQDHFGYDYTCRYNTLTSNNKTTIKRWLTATSTNPSCALSNFLWESGGKYYAEITLDAFSLTVGRVGITIPDNSEYNIGQYTGTYYEAVGWDLTTGRLYHSGSTSYTSLGATATEGDVIMIAYDGTSGKVWFGKNGTWINGGDPAAGTNATYDGTSTMAADDFIVGISSIGSSASLTLEATLLSYGTEVTYTPPTGFDTLDDPAGPQSGNISFSLQPLDVVATGSNGDYSGDIAIYLQPLGVSSTIGSGHINISFQPLSFFAYAPLNEYKLEIALQPLGVDILVGSKDISISLQPLTITIEADANAPAYLNASLQPLSIAATADASEYGFVNISLKPLAVDITGIKGEVADISFSLKALNVSASEKAEEEDDPFISMTMQALTVRAKATAPTGLPQALRYSRRQLR